jgi:hypothetical protein
MARKLRFNGARRARGRDISEGEANAEVVTFSRDRSQRVTVFCALGFQSQIDRLFPIQSSPAILSCDLGS